jgi:membrane protease YdiL (CAAX protease family)
LSVSEPLSTDRKTGLWRALLFLAAAAPIWIVPRWSAAFHSVAMLGVLLGATLLFVWWDKRSPSVLGLDLSWRRPLELLGGLLGGALLIAIIAVLLHLVLPFEWVTNPAFLIRLSAVTLLFQLVTTGVEELTFRGYALERLMTSIGLWPALLVTTLAYSLFRLVNGAPWQVAFTSTVIGSLMFGLVFARTRSVLASTGFHAAVNWARDLVLSDPPNFKSWLGPFAGRPWTTHERQTTLIVFNAVALLVCAVLWWSIRRRDRALPMGETRAEGRRGERALAK